MAWIGRSLGRRRWLAVAVPVVLAAVAVLVLRAREAGPRLPECRTEVVLGRDAPEGTAGLRAAVRAIAAKGDEVAIHLKSSVVERSVDVDGRAVPFEVATDCLEAAVADRQAWLLALGGARSAASAWATEVVERLAASLAYSPEQTLEGAARGAGGSTIIEGEGVVDLFDLLSDGALDHGGPASGADPFALSYRTIPTLRNALAAAIVDNKELTDRLGYRAPPGGLVSPDGRLVVPDFGAPEYRTFVQWLNPRAFTTSPAALHPSETIVYDVALAALEGAHVLGEVGW